MTAEFNKNVLSVLNRELGADFDLDAFEHVAFWDDENLWVDIRLRSLARQVVEISSLGMSVAFDRGEEMRTEISTKFAREGLGRHLRRGGPRDGRAGGPTPTSLFALSLARRAAGVAAQLGRQRLDHLAELVRAW